MPVAMSNKIAMIAPLWVKKSGVKTGGLTV